MSSCLFLAYGEVVLLKVVLIRLAPVEILDLLVCFPQEVRCELLGYFG